MFKAENYVGHKLCWPDDLVINSLWAWGRGIGVAQDHGIVSTAYGVYRGRSGAGLNPAFLHHLVRSDPFQWELQVRSRGVWKSRLQLTDERWLDAPLFVPPADEQAAIVKYLAHANSRIDKAIAAKRRLIALLGEESRARVEAVLEDVAANAPAPLLGRALHRVEQGMSPSAAEGELADDQWAVLTLSAVNRGTFKPDALKPVEPTLSVPAGLELHDGDLLMTRSNTRERVGDVALVRGVRAKTFMSDLIYRLVPRQELLSPGFADILLRSRRVRSQIEGSARGSSDTMPKLAQSHIKALRIPLPSLDGQVRAVAIVNGALQPTRVAIDRSHLEIDLLQEFRTRLVADVVTGQVDVRAIAASLPEVDPGDGWVGARSRA
ncbi:MAG: hypothetical protein ACRDPS_00090 [Nocardioides sp.]|uniref:hypothetical protein n=1 Tax=Nocardioides sp. TaxID=35761 RepID=UPI003D6C6357